MADLHTNFAYATVATAPSPATSGLSLVVAAGKGALFGSGAVAFNATVWPAGVQPLSTNAEIVRVTNISTDTFTIVRAQETTAGGPAARTILVGDQIAMTVTAKSLTDIEAGGISVASQAQYDLFYASSTSQAARIVGAASAVLVTDGSKVPSLSQTLPTAVQDNITRLGAVVTCTSLVVQGAISSSTSVALTGTTNNLGTITSGVWNAGAVTSSGLLTVNGFGDHAISSGGTGRNSLQIRNTTSGTGNFAQLDITAGTTQAVLYSFSQGWTPTGYNLASATTLYAGGAGGLSIAADNASGAIRFYSGGATERGRWTSAGDFVAGQTIETTTPSGHIHITTNGGAHDGYSYKNSSTSYPSVVLNILNSAGAKAGDITHTNTTTVAYNSVSDQRLKDDLGLATDLSALRALRVHDFAWKSDGTLDRNVFAQEAYAVLPRWATPGTDERNAQGALMRPWVAEKAAFVPDLIVGWQNHESRLAALEARSH